MNKSAKSGWVKAVVGAGTCSAFLCWAGWMLAIEWWIQAILFGFIVVAWFVVGRAIWAADDEKLAAEKRVGDIMLMMVKRDGEA